MPQSLDLTNLNGLNLDLFYLLRSLILIALLMPARFLLLARC